MKTCNACRRQFPLTSFYAQPGAGDGRGGSCKNCVKTHVRANRAENIEHYREFDRQRADLPHRVAGRKEYAQTDRGKERVAAGSKAWAKRHPEQRKAHVALNNALRDKRIIRPDRCDDCQNPGAVHGHHDDYTKPLIVRWLCVPCYALAHKDERAILRASKSHNYVVVFDQTDDPLHQDGVSHATRHPGQ